MPPTGPTLGSRALGRATLARQHLLEPASLSVAEELEHLVGMQSQIPTDPYVALRSRLTRFDPEELSRLMTERRAVRMTLMRGTIHLVTARDALTLRPIMQGYLERLFHRGTPFGRQVAGVDLAALLEEGRRLVDEKPRTTAQLGRSLQERWPDHDRDSLAYAVRYIVPLVQVTPRGVWGRSAQPTFTSLEAWLGRPMDGAPPLDELVLRYLGAFGPASVADMQNWSRLTRLREVFERLRPRLTTFRAEDGRELFDLPDAARPDAATPAPIRFLPTYDNVLLGHADRSRFMPPTGRSRVFETDLNVGTFLVDGVISGAWRVADGDGTPTLGMTISAPVTPADRAGLVDEAERLVRFLRPTAERHAVTLTDDPRASGADGRFRTATLGVGDRERSERDATPS